MIRWLRIAVIVVVIAAVLGLGGGLVLILVENGGDVTLRLHPWLRDLFGDWELVVWMPALMVGWLIAVVAVGGSVLWSMFYVWRRRQYETLVEHLERELVRLRNLPLDEPAPFEDLPEPPSPEAARILARAEHLDEQAELPRPSGAGGH